MPQRRAQPALLGVLACTGRKSSVDTPQRQADPARLSMVLDSMVARHVAWVPTLDIYEASRDLQRAQNQPWFKDYLHPTLEQYFKPNANNHDTIIL